MNGFTLSEPKCEVCGELLNDNLDVALWPIGTEIAKARFVHLGRCHKAHDRTFGLWSWHHIGQWHSLVTTGDMLDVGTHELRKMKNVFINGSEEYELPF